MQTTIYYQERDQYLLDKVEMKAQRERKSKSAVILSIIESHFEAEKKIGDILRDLGVITSRQLQDVLKEQQERRSEELIGEIMLDEGYVQEIDIDRALSIQSRTENRK